MPTYVAFLRGIGPTNPAMSNANLTKILRSAGCRDVQPVLTSGNFIFKSTSRSAKTLASKIEGALTAKLQAAVDVVVQSEADLDALVKKDPFKGTAHGKEWYLTVTFRKEGSPPVFSKLDRAKMDGPQFMTDLEKRHGKHITTRTWNTVQKVLARMQTTAAQP